MNFETIQHQIEEWIKPVLTEKDFFLVDIKFPMGKQIEVYVDSDTGIQISECAKLSRLIEKNLDESGLVPENYTLEVSSPGMTNPLKVPRQYKRRIGRILEIVKNDGTELEAQLLEVNEDSIKLKEVQTEVLSKTQLAKLKGKVVAKELKEYVLNYADIKKAVVQFNF